MGVVMGPNGETSRGMGVAVKGSTEVLQGMGVLMKQCCQRTLRERKMDRRYSYKTNTEN